MSFGGYNSFSSRNNDYNFRWNAPPRAAQPTVAIKKDNYNENPIVKRRSQAEVGSWLAENDVTINGCMPNPILKFEESGFPEAVVNRLRQNYQLPTTIQSITWPCALSGIDLISIAKTGSGKTLGFILPAIVHVLNQPPRQPGDGPIVVVLLPTRELALQVEEVAKEYGQVMNMSVCCCYGGAPRGMQSSTMRRGVDLCIATPGRLLDFMNGGITSMNRCSFLVLDEADRMLDMGFEPQIRQIVEQIRPDRQTLMFSATWPRDVRQLAADFHKDPVHLTVGSLDLAANHNIEQFVEVIDEYSKNGKLFEVMEKILNFDQKTKILIFTETKRKADELVSTMRRDGFPALCIHGDKEQREREWVMNEFKTGRNHILVATDVAARGLDVDDIKYVINFDYPNNSEDYVHRIGRTGRRDRTGTSITFFTPQNAPKARDLIKVLEEAKQNVPPQLADLANSGGYDANGYGSFRSRGRPSRGNDYGGSFAPTGGNRTFVAGGGGGGAYGNEYGSTNGYSSNNGGSDWGRSSASGRGRGGGGGTFGSRGGGSRGNFGGY